MRFKIPQRKIDVVYLEGLNELCSWRASVYSEVAPTQQGQGAGFGFWKLQPCVVSVGPSSGVTAGRRAGCAVLGLELADGQRGDQPGWEGTAVERSMAGAAAPWILLPGAAALKLLAASLSLSLQEESSCSSLPALRSQSCWQGEAAFLLVIQVLPKKSCGGSTGEVGDGGVMLVERLPSWYHHYSPPLLCRSEA